MQKYAFLLAFPLQLVNLWDTQLNLCWEPGSDKQIAKFVFQSPVTMITRKERSKLFSCHYERYGKILPQSTEKNDGIWLPWWGICKE